MVGRVVVVIVVVVVFGVGDAVEFVSVVNDDEFVLAKMDLSERSMVV